MGIMSINGADFAENAQGDRVAYARRYVYQLQRSSLVKLFSDADLTESQANPMVADENGSFANCYAVDGFYRVVIKSPRGKVLATFDNVEFQPDWRGQYQAGGSSEYKAVFDNASEMLADSSLSYQVTAGDGYTQAGQLLRVRGGGFLYTVAPAGAADHHLTTAGGVKLWVQLGEGGFANIKAFGATGIDNSNQNAALVAAMESNLPVVFPEGTYVFTTPLSLMARWKGVYRGSPGVGPSGTILKFTGTGQAITTTAPFDDFQLVSDTAVTGQSGLLIVNALMGNSYHRLKITDFDGTALAVGVKGVVGSYFIDVNGVEIRNNARDGEKGVYVAGLALPNSNANMFTNVFVTGRFQQYFHVEGNSNTFLNCDANPFEAGVAGGISSVFNIEGHLNTFTNTYVEPMGSTPPQVFFRFGEGANSNRMARTYLASLKGGGNTDGRTVDLGANNNIEICGVGFNFPQTVGTKDGLQNLCPNSHFMGLKPDGLPNGWRKSGTGTISRETGTLNGAPYAMRLEAASSAVTLQTAIATANPTALVPLANQRGARFADKTVTVGVWCWSDNAGLGAIKVNAGGATVGSQKHTGSGEWEFLCAQVRAESGVPGVSLQLRTDNDNLPQTGACFFSEPVVCLGGEVPKFPEPRSLNDAEAAMAGRIVHNPIVTLPDGGNMPDISEGNIFATANTTATNIVNFAGRHVGGGAQEIKLFIADSNTSLANNGNIRTTTNTLKPLQPNTVCKLLWNGTMWIEY